MTGQAAIERLTLVAIRSYERLALDLQPGLTLLVGSNGAGKTNVLESCAVGLTGASPRTSSEHRLLRDGHLEGRIALRVRVDDAWHDRDVTFRHGQGKQLRIDGAVVRSIDQFAAAVPCVTFLPERLLIVRGAPQRRRALIDQLAARIIAGAGASQRDYSGVLQQRNAVLRRARAGARVEPQLAPWTQQLLEHATAIRRQRQQLLGQLADPFADRFEQLTGLTDATFTDQLRGTGDLAADAAEVHSAELRRGTTLFGPHLDDILPMLAGRDLRAFGSAGEQRAALLAYCLAARDLLAEHTGIEPIMLLDEPWSELDAERRRRLSLVLAECTQVLVTTTELPRHLRELDTALDVLQVSSGTVQR